MPPSRAWVLVASVGATSAMWSCGLISGVDQLQKVQCIDACDASPTGTGGDAESGIDAASASATDAGAASDSGSGSEADGASTSDAGPALDAAMDSGPASPYRAAVLADSPMGYWRLGDTSGTTVRDETGNGHNGTVLGTVTFGAAGALAHDSDTAIQFTNTPNTNTGTIDVGTAFTFTGNDAFTWELWVKPSVLNQAFIPFFSSMTYDTNGDPIDGTYMVSYSSGGDTFGFERYNGGAAAVIALDTAGLTKSTWTYVVATTDASGAGIVYMNGEVVLSSQGKGTVPAYTASTIFGQQFNGTLDEIAIYDHVLSADRVTAHWNAGTE